jgi:hypothetical protein
MKARFEASLLRLAASGLSLLNDGLEGGNHETEKAGTLLHVPTP